MQQQARQQGGPTNWRTQTKCSYTCCTVHDVQDENCDEQGNERQQTCRSAFEDNESLSHNTFSPKAPVCSSQCDAAGAYYRKHSLKGAVAPRNHPGIRGAFWSGVAFEGKKFWRQERHGVAMQNRSPIALPKARCTALHRLVRFEEDVKRYSSSYDVRTRGMVIVRVLNGKIANWRERERQSSMGWEDSVGAKRF